MKIQKYKKIIEILNNFLKKNKNDEYIFFIHWLHLTRIHKNENAQYYIFNKNILIRIFPYKIVSVFLKVLIDYFFYKKFVFKKTEKCEDIFVSHITNLPKKNKFQDRFFPDSFKNNNSVTLLINGTKFSDVKLQKLLQKDHIILSKYFNLASYYEYFVRSIRAFFRIRYSYQKSTSDLEKDILLKSSNELFSAATLSNHKLKQQFKEIFDILSPKRVFFTLEGHTFERSIVSAAREVSSSIRCIGYQHSSQFCTQNSIFQSYGTNYDPDIVLTTGPLASKFAKSKFENKNIQFHAVGTTKRLNNIKIIGNDCLIAPEGYLSEVKLLCKFGKKIAVERPDINFILRLHPRSKNSLLTKLFLNSFAFPKNFYISDDDIAVDLKKCSTLLYRGSTVAIQAGCVGIIPIYLKLKDELSIDPLFLLGSKTLKINTIREFLDIYDIKVKSPDVKSYCDDYYVPLKNFTNNKIFES